MRTMARRVPVDDVIRGCLYLIARCRIDAAGVLADYLDETGHPLRSKVRELWRWYTRRQQWWQNADLSRRRYTAWEAVAWDRRRVRRQIGGWFGRRWKSRPTAAFK
jgi:hypothetical protein